MRHQASEADVTPSQLHAESSLALDPPVITKHGTLTFFSVYR